MGRLPLWGNNGMGASTPSDSVTTHPEGNNTENLLLPPAEEGRAQPTAQDHNKVAEQPPQQQEQDETESTLEIVIGQLQENCKLAAIDEIKENKVKTDTQQRSSKPACAEDVQPAGDKDSGYQQVKIDIRRMNKEAGCDEINEKIERYIKSSEPSSGGREILEMAGSDDSGYAQIDPRMTALDRQISVGAQAVQGILSSGRAGSVRGGQPGAYPANNNNNPGAERGNPVTHHPRPNNNDQQEQSGRHHGGSHLVEADPVDSKEFNQLQTAEEIDLEAGRTSSSIRSLMSDTAHPKNRVWLLAAVGLVIVVCAIVGIAVNKQNTEPQQAKTHPTMTPSKAISPPPTMAPTGPLDLFLYGLPKHTKEALANISTPQWKAMDWLANHPRISDLREFRKEQLFGLTTFYYSMQGPQWPEQMKNNWLLYEEKNECRWFSGRYGSFVAGSYQAEKSYDRHGVGAPCNLEDEFQTLILFRLSTESKPVIPPELELLTNLSYLSLPRNNFNASMNKFVPDQMYNMSSLEVLNLHTNQITGSIPSDLARMESLRDLILVNNALTGSMPREMGSLSTLEWVHLGRNKLNGSIPTELGKCTGLEILNLEKNFLTGTIPTTLGRNLYKLFLPNNLLTGEIPSQLGLMQNLTFLKLENNGLTGSIPEELGTLAVSGSLSSALLFNNSLTGRVPEGLCSLGQYNSSLQIGLDFGCSEDLCGCCWCPCPGDTHSEECEMDPFARQKTRQEWPGAFPSPEDSSTSVLTINVHTDSNPEETSVVWSIQDDSGEWEVLSANTTFLANSVTSYDKELMPETLHKLEVLDSYGDGNCCRRGFGWFTATSSSQLGDDSAGTVVWEAAGYELDSSIEVLLWVDKNGNATVRNASNWT